MKQILILSGKGGTGKTTVASAFIKLSEAKAYADCDVDAPNLHLIAGFLGDAEPKDYYGMRKAFIDADVCTECGICQQNCRFGAVLRDTGYYVDGNACEGCGVCAEVCPVNAVKMTERKAGDLFLYRGGQVFSTAKLKIGGGTSGKMVTEVKKRLISAAEDIGFAIIDGSPGIGCPVIASLSGAAIALIVTEPSVSGISDMERIIKTAKYFGVETAVCVNKYDTNIVNTEKIIAYCKKNSLPFLGTIPYDSDAVKAVNEGKSIVEIECKSGNAVKTVYANLFGLMREKRIIS
jgi:MinD superfamily P-loop ATPase